MDEMGKILNEQLRKRNFKSVSTDLFRFESSTIIDKIRNLVEKSKRQIEVERMGRPQIYM